jgi:hypothetical protein
MALTSGVRFPAGVGIFFFDNTFILALKPTQPPIQWVQGVLSKGVKWPGRGVNHTAPSSAEVKNAWRNTSISPIRLHGVVIS